MSLPSSGSIDAAQQRDDVLDEGREAARRARTDFTGIGRVISRVTVTPCTDADAAGDAHRLDILKALGDNTRYAIYLELARSPLPAVDGRDRRRPRPAPEHRAAPPRAHARGRPARGPRRRPRAASAAPAPLLAGRRRTVARARAAVVPAAGPPAAAHGGRAAGRRRRRGHRGRAATRAAPTPARGPTAPTCLDALITELATLGLRPGGRSTDDDGATVAFTHCPFRELAEAHPDLVCSLHRGLVEGFVDGVGGGRGRGVPHARRPRARARSTSQLGRLRPTAGPVA